MIEAAKFRVVGTNVSVLGVTLPPGDYVGAMEWIVFYLQGQEQRSPARALIRLDREFLIDLGARVVSNLQSVDCDLLSYLISGEILVIVD